MKRNKSRAGKIILAVLGLFLVGGIVGTVTTGALTDWTFNLNDPFKDVRIESEEVEYDGETKTLNVNIPEGASYELTIINEEGNIVDECKEIGVYTFTYKIKIEDIVKEYVATLTIKSSSTIDSRFIENGVTIKKANYYTDDSKNSVAEITYSVEPAGMDQTIEIYSIDWAPNDQCATDDDTNYLADGTAWNYVVAEVDVSTNTIKIVNKESKAFRHEINIVVRSVIDNNVTATIKVGYKRRFNVGNENLIYAQNALGDFYSGFKDIVINYEDTGPMLYQGIYLPEIFSDTTIKFNEGKTIKFAETDFEEVSAQQYAMGVYPPAIMQLSNSNWGTTMVWNTNPSYGLSLSIEEERESAMVFHPSLFEDYWDQTTGKVDIVNYILENFLNREVNETNFRYTLLSKFTNSSLNYYYSDFYNLFEGGQNPEISSNQPFVKIPKDLLTVNFGELGSVPYREFFKEDTEVYLNIWINCGPDISMTLEDDSVLF